MKKRVGKCRALKGNGKMCEFKALAKYDNQYCDLHVKHWRTKLDDPSIKRCNSRRQCDPDNPGIKAILPNGSKYRTCERCREHCRKNDKMRRTKTQKLNEKSDIKLCQKCKKEITPEHQVITSKGDASLYCRHCYDIRKTHDVKRRGTDHYKKCKREYEKRDHRKAYKKKLRQDNPDKYYQSYERYRAKQLAENPEAYRARNAARMKVYRRNNPDKICKKNYQNDIKYAYRMYRYRSERSNYPFDLSMEQFKDILSRNCYFCGQKETERLSGVDRIDNDKGYSVDNCVTCCKKCNMMKNTLNESTFILMCMHITDHTGYFEIDSFDDVFNDYPHPKYYNAYKNRAIKRLKIPFELTKKQMNRIITEPCYLCGKKNSPKHRNGIDRVNNSLGYTLDNCQSCCADCNFMKKNLEEDTFLIQCGFIAARHLKRIKYLRKIWTPSRFVTENKKKLTARERAKLSKKKKEMRHQRTMASKTPEAIAKKMIEIRKAHNIKKKRKSFKKIIDDDL